VGIFVEQAQEQGRAWVEQVSGKRTQEVRIGITPEWVAYSILIPAFHVR
jgi:hypothetical protein